MAFKNVSHVIFDMDGLLIESESFYDKIVEDIAASCGKKHTQDVKVKILGRTEQDTANVLISELQLPFTQEEFLEIYRNKVNEVLMNPPLMPGAKKLVQHLYKHKIPIAVATSSTFESMELKTQFHQDLFRLFSHIVCGSTDVEVTYGKPAPDIFLVCAARFPDRPAPEMCLVFEDAPNGAKGATAAGMQVVLVPAALVTEDLRKPATVVLNSLNEFQPEAFGLPAFD